jgi:hypothetical protein
MSAPVLDPNNKDLGKTNQAVNEIGKGRSNAVGVVTLTAGAATTTVAATNCGAGNKVFLFPCTANAAAIVAATYVQEANVTAGQFIVNHTNNANADKTFFWVALG